MKKYIKLALGGLLLIGFGTVSYFVYNFVKATEQIAQIVVSHDAALIKIICDNKLEGFMDLTKCPK